MQRFRSDMNNPICLTSPSTRMFGFLMAAKLTALANEG